MISQFHYDEDKYIQLNEIYARLVKKKAIGIELQHLLDYINFMTHSLRPHLQSKVQIIRIEGPKIPNPLEKVLETMKLVEERNA